MIGMICPHSIKVKSCNFCLCVITIFVDVFDVENRNNWSHHACIAKLAVSHEEDDEVRDVQQGSDLQQAVGMHLKFKDLGVPIDQPVYDIDEHRGGLKSKAMTTSMVAMDNQVLVLELYMQAMQ